MRLSKLAFKALIVFSTFGLVISYNACSGGLPFPVAGLGDQNKSALSSSVDLNDTLALQKAAIQILSSNCTACHTATSGPMNVYNVTDPAHLIQSGLVVAGQPDASPLLAAVESNSMPPSMPLLDSDKMILRAWIESGAQAPDDGSTPGTPDPVTPTKPPPPTLPPLGPSYSSLNLNVFIPKCVGCHSATLARNGVRMDNYTDVTKLVVKGSPSSSLLYQITSSGQMPQSPNPRLTSAELSAISSWIKAGAPNN